MLTAEEPEDPAESDAGHVHGGAFTSVEICAGGGGQALGLEQAGFTHLALVEVDRHSCETLRLNRPGWNVVEEDLVRFDGTPYRGGVDLLAGGVPCPPFSVAGKRLGARDERDLFPEALRLTEEIRPRAVMIENVRGILASDFDAYRAEVEERLHGRGYRPMGWKLFNASNFGVPQLRPRTVFVAIQEELADAFSWPVLGQAPETKRKPRTVGQALVDQMASGGWEGAERWSRCAAKIAPTIVGGSKKHGGPDLGPTRAKRAWAALGVNGMGVAEEPPPPGFVGMPKLTVPMVARLQGFPDDWHFAGRKTAAYRQVGNAFPPPVARAVGRQIMLCLAMPKLALYGQIPLRESTR